MRAPNLPLAPLSPEPQSHARARAEGAQSDAAEAADDDDVRAAKRRAALSALELDEECPVCLEDFCDPDNPPMLLTGCSHRFHLPCLLALEQRGRFCPCCNAAMEHPELGR